MNTNEPIPESRPLVTAEEKTWGMLTHLSAFAQFIIPTFGMIIGPLVIWLIKKDTMPFINDQGREVLNFNISVAIYFIISGALVLVMVGFVLLPLIALFWIVFTIIGAIKANEGVAYRYPLTIRFLK